MFPNVYTTSRLLALLIFCACAILWAPTSFADEPSVNLNTATAEQLVELRGIGPDLAQRILDYRASNGPFKSVDELTNVKGIGKGKLDKIRDVITIDISAETAKGATDKKH